MASEKILEGKKEKVAALAEKLQNSVSFVLVDYAGISVEDDTKLRREMREAGVSYSVEKNSILAHAFQTMGIEEAFKDTLNGATAIAISPEDQTAPARILGAFAEQHEDFFNLKAGYVEGVAYDREGVEKLSKIPSKEVLLAQLVGSLQGPMQKLAATIQAVADSKSAPEPEPTPGEDEAA